MKLPKRGQKGFTLIELLIVVAILGVLAAVVIPNIAQFIGAGTDEAMDTEFTTIQAVVHSMMVDNKIATLPTPVSNATAINDMGAFPDTSVTADGGLGAKDKDPAGVDYELADKDGYLLYQHDIIGDASDTANLVNYATTQTTAYWYTVDVSGTITQWDDAAKSNQLNP